MQLRRKELNAEFLNLSHLTTMTFDNVFHWCLIRNTVWEAWEQVEFLSKYLKADPEDRWSRIALAESLRQIGRDGQAERTLDVLPESDPDARAVRARIVLDRGDDRGSSLCWREGRPITPSSPGCAGASGWLVGRERRP